MLKQDLHHANGFVSQRIRLRQDIFHRGPVEVIGGGRVVKKFGHVDILVLLFVIVGNFHELHFAQALQGPKFVVIVPIVKLYTRRSELREKDFSGYQLTSSLAQFLNC